MAEIINPYTAGDPVGKTEFFLGREDVLREVLRVLRHPTQNAITLYGQRRIGKTSILQYLEAHLPEQGAYQPVYFDLMHKAGLPLDDILCDLARSVNLRLKLPDSSPENTTAKNFREIYLPRVLSTLPEQASLVLLLDEFDVLAEPQAEQQSKRQFFSYLRDLRLLDQKRLQFIFVLGRNVDDLDVVAQGLFKDLPSRRVSLLVQNDAEALVRLSERQGSLAWLPEAVTRMWGLTSGHPYLTQAICSQIWEDAHEYSEQPAPVQILDVENAVSGTLDRSQNMFSWLWDGLGPAEKVVAAALAGVGPTIVDEERLENILSESGVRILIGELQNAPKTLQKWDILDPVDGGYRFRVELLRRWIAENKPLSRTQDELDRINPVANNLFNAASGFYQGNNLEQAEPLLRQALGLNSNHLRANEMLVEILLAKNNLDEAQQVLERLADVLPNKAHRRLKQVYLKRAEIVQNNAEKLKWFEKVLTMFPSDPQTLEARRQVYRDAGERALDAQDFRTAMAAFQQAEDTQLYDKANNLYIQHKIVNELNEIARLESAKIYQEAYQRLEDLATSFPDKHPWQVDLERIKVKILLDEKYKQALGAIQQGERVQAKKLLADVISIDPDYEQASRYLHLAVTGNDPLVPNENLASNQDHVIAQEQFKAPVPAKVDQNGKQPKPATSFVVTPKLLNIWNPFSYLTLSIWVLIQPVFLKAYKKTHGEIAEKSVTHRLIYFLTLLPVIMPLINLGLGMISGQVTVYGRQFFLSTTLGISIIWLILFGLAEFISLQTHSGIVGFSTSVIALIVIYSLNLSYSGMFLGALIIIGVTSMIGITASAKGGQSADIETCRDVASAAVGYTIGIPAFLFYSYWTYFVVIEKVAGFLAGLGAGSFTGIWASIMAFLISVISLILATIAAFCWGTIVAILAGLGGAGLVYFSFSGLVAILRVPFQEDKPAYLALILLALNFCVLAFYLFGGLGWLQTGTWPAPTWPF